jgi:8-oxo-dGTP pyrophosphatase MutT (NUDIX family)
MLLLPPTCGLVITSPAGWLLAHATAKNYWDLPKGKANVGEAPLMAALRECLEETGLDFRVHRDRFHHLGSAPYNLAKGKTLTLFGLTFAEPFDLSGCHCHVMVHNRGPEPVPEMDDFAWVPQAEVAHKVNSRMAAHLRRRGLLPADLVPAISKVPQMDAS